MANSADLSLQQQVSAVISSCCFYQLRQLRCARRSLDVLSFPATVLFISLPSAEWSGLLLRSADRIPEGRD